MTRKHKSELYNDPFSKKIDLPRNDRAMTTTMHLRTTYCAAVHAIHMHMRHSRAPMITDGTGDALGLHRPGWRIALGGSQRDVLLRDSQRKTIEDAHAEYLDRLTNAWRAEPKDGGRR